MKKLNPKIMILTSIGVLSLCLQPSLATSISEWKPNLSEKILLLPPQHLEQAIDQDFSIFSLRFGFHSDIEVASEG